MWIYLLIFPQNQRPGHKIVLTPDFTLAFSDHRPFMNGKVQQRSTAKLRSICWAKLFRPNTGSRAMNLTEVRLLNRIFYVPRCEWFWLQSHQRASPADELQAAKMNGLPIQATCQPLHRSHHSITPLKYRRRIRGPPLGSGIFGSY
jgi:hypothetical protein